MKDVVELTRTGPLLTRRRLHKCARSLRVFGRRCSTPPGPSRPVAEQLRLFLGGIGLAWLLVGCAAARNHASLPVADPGRILFTSYCAACHLSSAPGMAAEAPPLDGSPWVKGPEDRLIKIVVQGLRGAVDIGGKTYNQEMPAAGQFLTDEQVATLLSFVRRQFGGVSVPMLSVAVHRVRAANENRSGYWTVGELSKEP